MEQMLTTPVTSLLIAGNVIASLIALSNPSFMAKNLFHVGPILQQKEWHRMVTSGFLHGGILHLLVNMYVLFMFGGFVERVVGPVAYLIIYFAALLGGNAWALLENKAKPSYRALGASGATSGIVMSFILFRPFEPLMIFPIPFFMPAVVLGIVFLVGSAILSQRDNKRIGHEAHLGGALAGILVTIAVQPAALSNFSQQVARALGGS
ncbi:MAG: rhomboid family intramembrane serine protease [Henriciella sp.]|jgi:membrane associated rhomboid family serine protease|nr:rhomboid family intramembrane serine protease [Henriciella sp.]MBO6696741.1 rhomboid family intramembrane serine protease [Henriciella sp.]